VSRTLVVTNDFPTRVGGIETFVIELCKRMDPDDVVVYTSSMPGDLEYDAGLPFPVYRDPASMLLPTPAVGRRVVEVMRRHDCDRVVFGASAPLGLLGSRLRRAGARRMVALTHGHEVWWARLPGTRRLLRRIGDSMDVMTYVSEWCREQIAPALSPAGAERMRRLTPGVDPERFRPDCGGDVVRKEWGIPAGAPVAVCSGRLVKRKGQDTLLRAWPQVLREVPDARLLIIGQGPYGEALQALAAELGVSGSVLFAGRVSWAEMSAYFDAGDVFAMPCRSRLHGLEQEALGIVFLEAAATGLPVIVGDSGGAGETVVAGETGELVPPRRPDVIAMRLVRLLSRPEEAARQGAAGRSRVLGGWTWDDCAKRLRMLLRSAD
jgi:phosphatidylinositol alpha-1,6-mannosyltransferase